MDMAAWRASSPVRAASSCTAQGARLQVCRIPDQPLGPPPRARGLTATFVDDRLASLAFTASIDSFSAAVGELTGAYGKPAAVVHDTATLPDGSVLPHVAMTWRNGRSTIALSDPAGRGGRMSVRYRLDAAAPVLRTALGEGARPHEARGGPA